LPDVPIDTHAGEPAEAPLMGLAALMTSVCSGAELTDLANQLLERIKRNPNDANALMDLAIISHLWFKHDIGLATQAQALRIRQHYRLPPTGAARIRLLAIMHHGDLAANTPLEFLVQGTDIALDMLYVDPARPFPASLPEHDVIFIAVGESDRSRAALKLIEDQMPCWKRPVLNRPERIGRLSRDSVGALLQSVPGVTMPLSVRLPRQVVERIGSQALPLRTMLADGDFPVIVRPVDSHAGHGLAKIDEPGEIAGYLQARPESEFYVSRFVDYRSADGLYRKYRIALVDGQAFAGHMAISEHWMIHYLNARMSASQEKRDEEARFMQHFDTVFAARHADALRAIHQLAGLDYLIVDCAESADGTLLVFEIDSAAVVHAMDPVETFPYKQAQMKKVFDAFQALLERAAAAPPAD
jgi:glutathione synthase/RimK-type ligase-like ATP-grasp enzyme